ncbi:uncharacterized protein LOC109713754 isoform X2 [Ananas comosus]|nr:uncharacterized protein LOC109713754 isoform X2 [Ananas comosus]
MVILAEYLVIFWDDSTCSGTSHCMLHNKILQIAAKCFESDLSISLNQFLILGTKASLWCVKHLQETVGSDDESEDENHPYLLSQIIFDALRFSSTLISVLTSSLVLKKDEMMLIIQNFISESLKLTRASIMESKKIHPVASEVLKVAQLVLDSAIKLCRAYSQVTQLDHQSMDKKRTNDDKDMDLAAHVIKITSCTIENLYDLGIFAASGGGSWVTLLNLSWKGLVSLLQLVKGVLTEVNVAGIISTLVSLAVESLRSASKAWSTTLQEPLTISEAKRTFLPIKFFLINAVRISSEYPSQAMNIYREIARCALIISSLVIEFSKETQLRSASEALVELLEPSSLLFLYTLLNSSEGNPESIFQILEWSFKNEESDSAHVEENNALEKGPIDSIFSLDSNAISKTGGLLPGRFLLFLNLLKNSQVLKEEVIFGLSRKLEFLFTILTDEYVYSCVLGLQIPALCSSGPTPEIAWQLIYTFLIQALKTFMIIAASFHDALIEVETSLLQNLFHPHFLPTEIITELWCFFIRHAEMGTVNHFVEKLLLVLNIVASSEQALTPLSALRKIAHLLCTILNYAPPATVDHVYASILSDNKSHASSITYFALLKEGFPFDSLSGKVKMLAIRKLLTAFNDFLENYSEDSGSNGFPGSFDSCLIGLPVHYLASALNYCHLKDSDIVDDKSIYRIFKFTHCLIHCYKSSTDSMKDQLAKILSSTLDIISNMKHLYNSNEMENLILDLHALFVKDSPNSNSLLHQCKPSLASFMAGLSHVEITESEGDMLCSAIWDLYHLLLRERHWALIHLAINSFGYFAARTSCTQLWRFVPDDAALSYDMDMGMNSDENRFMSELRVFLEKEVALNDLNLSREQLDFLIKEGAELKRLVKQINTISQITGTEKMEICEESNLKKKKRKVPDGICEGVVLLQSGLKVMRNALVQAEPSELQNEFSSQISSLEDLISHIVSLSGNVS